MPGTFWLDESTAKRYYERRAFTYNGIQYTNAGATAQTFAGLGFVKVTIGQRPDDRFYFVTGPDDTGAYNATPRDHVQMVGSFVQQEAETCKGLLAQTDWMVTRKMECGTEIPADWAKYREDCRNVCGQRQQAEMETKSTAELEALVKAPAEVYSEDSVLVANTEPHLTPWPIDPVTQAALTAQAADEPAPEKTTRKRKAAR